MIRVLVRQSVFQFTVFLALGILHVLALASGLLGSMDVLFYRGVVLLLPCAAVMLGLLFAIRRIRERRRLRTFPPDSVVAAVVTATALQLTFFTLVPVTIDRSVSVFVLARMRAAQQAGTPLTHRELESILLKEYVVGQDAIGRRMHEQRMAGNVIESGGRYELGPRGAWILAFADLVATVYGIPPPGNLAKGQ